MQAEIITPAEFAARFPRARAHEGAATYVIVEHAPRAVSAATKEAEIAAAGRPITQVGYTNASRSKTITRFAVL